MTISFRNCLQKTTATATATANATATAIATATAAAAARNVDVKRAGEATQGASNLRPFSLASTRPENELEVRRLD
jgi:hypothetical protein